MAIVTTILRRSVYGDRWLIEGKSVLSGGVATGDVITGLKIVNFFWLVTKAAAQKGCAVNEDFPLMNAGPGTVTVLVETNDSTFYWSAIGIRG